MPFVSLAVTVARSMGIIDLPERTTPRMTCAAAVSVNITINSDPASARRARRAQNLEDSMEPLTRRTVADTILVSTTVRRKR